MELKLHQKIPVKFSYSWVAMILVAAGYLFTLIKDYSQTLFTDSAYFFSESFLFSSFWWWFIPFFILQNRLLQREQLRLKHHLALYACFVLGHLLVSALCIDIVSGLFYEQRFRFWKGLGYSLAENGYILLLLYGIPLVVHSLKTPKANTEPETIPIKKVPETSLLSHILIQEGYHRIPITIAGIVHIQSSPPYVVIQTSSRKYLHKTTLSSMLQQLPSDQFVRIHKSTIVNIKEITSFRSRQNGDYDIMLKDHTTLRLSRNYTADFKRVMDNNTQDSIA